MSVHNSKSIAMAAVSVSTSRGSSMPPRAATKEVTQDKASATDYKSLSFRWAVVGGGQVTRKVFNTHVDANCQPRADAACFKQSNCHLGRLARPKGTLFPANKAEIFAGSAEKLYFCTMNFTSEPVERTFKPAGCIFKRLGCTFKRLGCKICKGGERKTPLRQEKGDRKQGKIE